MADSSKKIAKLLSGRRDVFAVSPDAPVLSALEILAARNVGALVVLDGARLVGIFSERDYARKVELQGRSARTTPVGEIMTGQVVSVSPDHTVEQCMALMNHHKVRHLPVVERGLVVGVLSSRDILQEMIAGREHLIHDLQQERLVLMNPDTGSY